MKNDPADVPVETSADENDSIATGTARWPVAFWISWLTATGLAAANEFIRWTSADPRDGAGGIHWWSDPLADWSPFLPVLLLAIPLWFVRRPLFGPVPRFWTALGRWSNESCPTTERPGTTAQYMRAFALSAFVAAAGWMMSVWVAGKFGDLPPAYHDEFSYIFQAQTFLAGRLSFPSHAEMPELFDQMHVLNEGRFASRYFPGAGMWIAPFLALGNPWMGYWIAHAFASFLVFWIGRHLGGNGVGFLAGLLMAVSPGVGLFSNLLLAHHPTLVGLLVFVITFLKLRLAIREQKAAWGWAFITGTALTFAMYCRPMTAAGVGLPFGAWFAWWLVTGRVGSTAEPSKFRSRVQTAVALAAPIAFGFAGLMVFNDAITGDPLLTPYQQYTDIYTPRHVYGFNNRVRGEAHLGPKVIENYDVWAENLTPSLAARNVWRRFVFSFRWTLGIVPLLMTAIIVVLTADRWSGDWRLIIAAIVSLHAVHIPYWFEGIMGWHYVFESAPFWLLFFAGVTQRLIQAWAASDRPGMPVWGVAFLGTVLLVNLVTIVPLWPSRVDRGVGEVGFSRRKHAAFQEYVSRLVDDRRALVLVEPDPADRHIDYVANTPDLNAKVLIGRYRPGKTDISEVVDVFADRDVWLIRAATGEATQVSRADSQ